MKAHETLIPLALFALAFSSALFVLRQPRPRTPAAVAPDRAIPAEAPGGWSAAGVARLLTVAGTAPESGASGAPNKMHETGAARASSTPASTTAGPRSAGQGLASATPAPRAASAAPDAEDSARPAGVPSLEPVVDAIDTLKYSGSADDRVRAIRSLAATARNGVEVARVRSSLRVAAADENPDVAARAQEEYDTLVEREDR